MPEPASPQNAAPPAQGAEHRIVYLLDASSQVERHLLERWIEENHPAGTSSATVPIPPSRRHRRQPLDPRLEAALATDDDPLLAPLRVAWLPPGDDGARGATLSDVFTCGDPRDPSVLRQEWVRRRHPERVRIVAGEPAPLSELRRRWREAGGVDAAYTTGLADFAAQQATLALERAERRLRGSRYKVPRFLCEDILGRPAFRGGLARLAAKLGEPEEAARRKGARYLREIAATHSPYMIDLSAHLIHSFYSRGYSELHYDAAKLAEIYTLGQRAPLVFLPTHKSNLDHLVLQYVLHENGHPPNHTAGGINMNFFPVGPLVRRSGTFFIRRTFKDNHVYKFVLAQYIDYLIEKRFPLEWYLEGGRSRLGKLLPPRFGMFAYVVDAYRRGKSDDVFMVPVSIAYDQIQDIGDYVREQRGGAKEHEGIRWVMHMARRLRHNYGAIHISFGEPLSLREFLGPPNPSAEPNPDERNLSVQKVAFEVAVRINRVTPITPTSLVTLALLGYGDRALTVSELVTAMEHLVSYVRRRNLPTTTEIDLDTVEGVERALNALVASRVVTPYSEGLEVVYAITPDKQLAAAYYRNTIIHFFVNAAIVELALLRAAEVERSAAPAEFWDEAARLRDLLKFEFFFADRDTFRAELAAEAALQDPAWEQTLAAGPEAIRDLVRRIRPYTSHRVLRPFFEAYRTAGDALEMADPTQRVEEAAFLATCLKLGNQYRLQRRIRQAESVSKLLFANAFRLAANRGLLEPGTAGLAERRRAFSGELRSTIRRVDAIDALAASRRAGFIL